ncbi:glycerate kinase [Saccharopolyspora rosea]|uniref:Glycerate kinase n=1 Tax=Saccharopolyspora rosea TaxID=524884 RepID=A0ABW3FZZ3_9PSEU
MNAISILIAPDKFKGTLTAAEVAEHLRAGLEDAGRSGVRCTTMPLADGGDGTVAAVSAAGYKPVMLRLTGSDGARRTTAAIAFNGHTAVIEVANICGLSAVPPDERNPLGATSRGVGEAIRYATEVLAARRVVVGLGGSATTDGGAGMLHALGVRFVDRDGRDVEPRAGALSDLARVDFSGLIPLSGIEVLGASDVDNPLYGPHGAATVFAPQKGAGLDETRLLDRGLAHLARLTDGDGGLASLPGAGAAGGLGYGLLLLGGALTSGADFILSLLDFSRRAAATDVIVTGEGRLDSQTGRGKLIAAVARHAGDAATIAVVGSTTLTADESSALGLSAVYAIADRAAADTSRDAELSAQVLRLIGRELFEAISSRRIRDGVHVSSAGAAPSAQEQRQRERT